MVGRTSLTGEMLASTLPLGIRQLNGCGAPSPRRLRARVDGRLTAIWVEETRIALSSVGLSCAILPVGVMARSQGSRVGYRLTEITDHLNVHAATGSRHVRQAKEYMA